MYDACPAISCNYDADVPFNRWKKLLYNASYNSVATILRMDTARMRFSEHVIVCAHFDISPTMLFPS